MLNLDSTLSLVGFGFRNRVGYDLEVISLFGRLASGGKRSRAGLGWLACSGAGLVQARQVEGGPCSWSTCKKKRK
jgi:hypothetical protein